MRRTFTIAACALVAACNSSAPDERICTAGISLSERQAAADRISNLRSSKTPIEHYNTELKYVDHCLRRWGYTLAQSEAGRAELTTSIVEACAYPLGALRKAAAKLPAESWTDENTGAPATLEGVTMQKARARATFYAVQGRLGRCR